MKKVLVVLLILVLTFIWGNSCKTVADSRDESKSFMEFIEPFLELFVGEGNVTLHLVRKLAHFTEFAALGAGLAGVFSSFRWQRRRLALLLPPLAALLIAVSDEVIQIFSPARGPGVRDVLLDFCGALFGIVCMRLLLRLIDRAGKKDT